MASLATVDRLKSVLNRSCVAKRSSLKKKKTKGAQKGLNLHATTSFLTDKRKKPDLAALENDNLSWGSAEQDVELEGQSPDQF